MQTNTSSTMKDEDGILLDNDDFTENDTDTRDGENIT